MERAAGARVGVALACALAVVCGGGCGFHPVGSLDGGIDGGTDDADTVFSVFDDNPDGGALRSVWGASPDEVHAVGDDGHILLWKDNQLYRINGGAGNDFTCVFGVGAGEVWAVGTTRSTGRGVIWKRAIDSWTEFGTTPLPLKSVWGAGDFRIAVGESGGLFTGTAMAPFSMGMQAQPNPNIPLTQNAPINWSVSGTSPSQVIVAADVDYFFLFDGAKWHAFDDAFDRTRTYRAVWGVPGGTDVYMGANYYGIWRYVGTQELYQVNEEKDTQDKFARFIWGVWTSSDGRYLVAVGDEGRLMTYDTQTMAPPRIRSLQTARSLYGVWGSSLDDLWLVGDGGLVLRGRISF